MAATRPGPEPASRLARLEPWLWGVGLAALRLPFFPLTEQDIDGANFARAVEHFDLAAWAPHPPGYPLLVAASKLARALFVSDPARAVAAFALAASIVLAASVFAVLARVFDKPTARLATALLLASPLVTLFSVRPLSDGPGAALAWATLALALRADALAKSRAADLAAAATLALVALLPGVRASALPFALPAVVIALTAARRPALPLAAFALALAAYLVPYALLVDLHVLFDRTLAHASGHFTEYGGSAYSVSDPVARLVALVRALWAHGLGGLWVDRPATTIGVTLALVAASPFFLVRTPRSRPARILAVSAGLYLAWILLGQNILEQPRHALPLVPAMLGPIAFAARRAFRAVPSLAVRVRRALLLAGAACALVQSSQLAFIQARYPAHIVRLARFVAAEPDASTITVATYRFYRWIGWRAPGVRVVSVGHIRDALALRRSSPGRVLVTSEVPGAERLDPKNTLLRVTTDPFVRYVFEDIRLIELDAPSP